MKTTELNYLTAAHLAGYTIQFFSGDLSWRDCVDPPLWEPSIKYRVKPSNPIPQITDLQSKVAMLRNELEAAAHLNRNLKRDFNTQREELNARIDANNDLSEMLADAGRQTSKPMSERELVKEVLARVNTELEGTGAQIFIVDL